MPPLSHVDYLLTLPLHYPDSWNLSTQDEGYNLPVKDQAACNMCWTIVPTDCAAMAMRILGINPVIVPLSSKDLLDCGHTNWNILQSLRCYKYSYLGAFIHMAEEGVMKEADLRFLPEKWPCFEKTDEAIASLVKIAGFETLDYRNEIQLMGALLEYPICGTVTMTWEFVSYQGGIYEGSQNFIINANGEKEEHGILIVGYGYDPHSYRRFWIVKNSHGEGWGYGGYGLIVRNSSQEDGEEPIITRTCRPIVETHDLDGRRSRAWHQVGNRWLYKSV